MRRILPYRMSQIIALSGTDARGAARFFLLGEMCGNVTPVRWPRPGACEYPDGAMGDVFPVRGRHAEHSRPGAHSAMRRLSAIVMTLVLSPRRTLTHGRAPALCSRLCCTERPSYTSAEAGELLTNRSGGCCVVSPAATNTWLPSRRTSASTFPVV